MTDREIREEYKRVFDEIHASDNLKTKILMQKKPSKRNFKPIIAAVSTAAAAVAILAAVQDYSYEPNNTGVISEVVSGHTEAPTTENHIVQYGEKVTQYVPESSEQTVFESDIIKTTAAPEIEKKPNVNAVENVSAPTEEIVIGVQNNEQIQQVTDAADSKKRRVDTELNVNPMSSLPISGAGAASAAAYAYRNVTETEEWDNSRYFDYIGKDVINGLNRSEDLVYTGEDSTYFTVGDDGVPVDDTRLFTFLGNDDRSLQITATKDLTYVNGIITDEQIELSNINGTDVAVFSDDYGYNINAIYSGTAYVINATSLSEDEIIDLLVSF